MSKRRNVAKHLRDERDHKKRLPSGLFLPSPFTRPCTPLPASPLRRGRRRRRPSTSALSRGIAGEQQVSAALWNSVLQRVYVVDDNSGAIARMDAAGSNKVSWTVSESDHDHEAHFARVTENYL
jgi:hypothetical protein